MPGNNNIGDVKDLAKAPYASTGLLISQLHTVKNPQRTVVGYGSAEINHLIWVIAALRYITGGMDFCAPTGWRPGKSQEAHYRSYWLHFADKRCVTFFAVWPSRGRYYFAPLDAQRRIIGAWRRWYAENGKSYNFRPLVNPEPWDWLEGVEKPVLVTGKGR